MTPAPTHATMLQGDQNTDSQHSCSAIGFLVGFIDECAEAGIFIVDKISSIFQQSTSGKLYATHTRSSSTLCRPEGRDLNSTTPSSWTATEV
jgi:hypothetical protein